MLDNNKLNTNRSSKWNVGIDFHQKFLDAFTLEELEDISNHATAIGPDCIVVTTEENFFELSADIGEELDIYCNNNTTYEGRKLTKVEFMELYKSSPTQELNVMAIDE